ncbi:MAG: hypothetical protein J3K34DRAFT_488549 [Monoraphidium minutum]|nr:MAG: hypothetical protein J3K34DRAFT_488549 [Monoraphidium minutum]
MIAISGISRTRSFTSAAPLARRAPRRRRAPAPPAAAAVSARSLLDDLASAGLGPTRFVVIGGGAILEAVGEWAAPRYSDSAARGPIATVASADKTFEAHFVLSKLSEARFALVEKPGAAAPLRVVRLLGADGAVAASMMLHQPAAAAAAAWDALRARYGDAVALEAPAAGEGAK